MRNKIETILIKVDEGIVPVQQALIEILNLFKINQSLLDGTNAESLAYSEFKNVGDEGLFPNHTDKDIWVSGFKAAIEAIYLSKSNKPNLIRCTCANQNFGQTECDNSCVDTEQY